MQWNADTAYREFIRVAPHQILSVTYEYQLWDIHGWSNVDILLGGNLSMMFYSSKVTSGRLVTWRVKHHTEIADLTLLKVQKCKKKNIDCLINATVVCILVRMKSFLRFWRNHPWYRKKWSLLWKPLVFLIRWSKKFKWPPKKRSFSSSANSQYFSEIINPNKLCRINFSLKNWLEYQTQYWSN